MQPQGIDQNHTLYCDLMEYIKWRIGAVQKTIESVAAKTYYVENRMAAEFCMLQLRFCCELLAVGCIAIHTDVPLPKDIQAQWNADRIMKKFHHLKPTFFPHPVHDQKDADGAYSQHEVVGALKKEELLRMYAFFGLQLHTGSFERYTEAKSQTYDFSVLIKFIEKFMALLSQHIYYVHGDQRMIRVIMHNEADGRVWLNVLEKREPPAS
jgi:hypothetical protein